MRNRGNTHTPNNNMADIGFNITIITLNVNGINIPNNRDLKSLYPTTCCLGETHFQFNNINKLNVEGWKKICTTIFKKQECLY